MFDNLVESKPRRERSIGQTIFSVVIHLALIVGAIKATQGAAETVQEMISQETEFVLNEPPPPPPPPPEDLPENVVVTDNPPPRGFQTIMPPRDLPTEIPPIDLNEKFDARDFSATGVEGGTATGVVGGVGPVITEAPSSVSYSIDEVDQRATRISGPDPVYPEIMESVGIEGVVRLRFVVGANGRVEANSVVVISSTNKAFESNAIEAVVRSTYRPAQIRGQAVRQMVEQNIRFTAST